MENSQATLHACATFATLAGLLPTRMLLQPATAYTPPLMELPTEEADPRSQAQAATLPGAAAEGAGEAPDGDENALSIALMVRVKAGDQDAFEQLVERHQGAVIGTVAKMLGDATEAHDVAQQVFIRVWKSAGRYQPKAKFTTWLFTITRNLVFNEMRRRKRRQEVSMEAKEEEQHKELAEDGGARPDEATLHDELLAKVEQAIQALPEKQRMAVILRRYEEMPYEDIGKILKLSLPAVKSLLFRARAQLKELLSGYLEQ